MNKIKNVEKKVIKLFKKAKGSHDWEHTKRVYNMCLHISETEKVDLDIIKYAALLHDIGRSEQDKFKGKISHEKLGAKMAKKILIDINIKPKKIKKILHCILAHRLREITKPKTIEARILFDADKLDGIGAIGIGRAFVFAGEVGAVVHNKDIDIKNSKPYSKEDSAYREFLVKLINIKDLLYTYEGKRLAKERHDFMVSFFERLNKEVDGII